jgi:hypothetical protein
MRNTLKTAAIVLALTASASHGEELAPDALVKTISLDVLAAIQKDKDIQGGNPKKIASLVEAKILRTRPESRWVPTGAAPAPSSATSSFGNSGHFSCARIPGCLSTTATR